MLAWMQQSVPIGSSAKLTHNKHCHVSLSSGKELMFGIWQFWWNTFGHLSQHINSPPSKQTAHQSSFGSSFCPLLSAKSDSGLQIENDIFKNLAFYSPSAGNVKSVDECTWGDVVLPRPSGNTCTPFESNLAIVAIKSLTDSSQALSIESV